MVKASPFLHPGDSAKASSMAVLHLRRDQMLPVVLQDSQSTKSGYAEGSVTNTRFGSFPHSTIVGQTWGNQVLASKVDTGSRGRGKTTVLDKKKRKAQDEELMNGETGCHSTKKAKLEDDDAAPTDQESFMKASTTAITASTGFCHIVPPTPESWTLSLPHRTQVVYTPDYSYILQKLQARPGSVLIEAGAGSGSFTHAAIRAVFSGYSQALSNMRTEDTETTDARVPAQGRVYSFEYHEPRAVQLKLEIEGHGLSSVVQVTHRDVYENGFLVQERALDGSLASSLVSPKATQIFLDLPAPWEALPHLTRTGKTPLDPDHTIHICIFLPCIEQVQKAVSALRSHGWVEIHMQHLSQKRLEVRRERVGLDLQGLRGVNATPATVEEAIERLIEVEQSGRRYQNVVNHRMNGVAADGGADYADLEIAAKPSNKAERLARIAEEAASKKAFNDGRLTQRTESDLKTHTSYLIFAVLPREWSEEDEARCCQRWPPERNYYHGKGKKEKNEKPI